MANPFSLEQHQITVEHVIRNAAPPVLYEAALRYEKGSAIASSGALVAMSGKKTGRSPADKRIVDEPATANDIWWGSVNIKLDDHTFEINRERAIDYLNTRERLYCVDAYANWDPAYRIKVRVICARAYHALFMHNMLIRPSREELADFGQPDYVIYNAGSFPANRYTTGMTSTTSIDLHLSRGEFVILGTEYAGEMKKGIFTVMNYLMPKRGVLSMHCSATEGASGDTSIMFGLSGTGKTTLSADPKRQLIGDDEHCWSDQGISNIEGGCYAKAINLDPKAEPDIYRAIRAGTVLENVVYDQDSRRVDFADTSITENTRASYPIEYIDNAKIPCVGGHPRHVIFLTCDAYGVLPPVAKLTPAQAMYHFISGYTAKVAGTEVGVQEPQVTFSPCFGGPFMVWHPTKYAELLASKLRTHGAQTWLVNTGWSGGPYGVGSRMKLSYTRAIVDAIHAGALDNVATIEDPIFGVAVPTACPNVPAEVLIPRNTWKDQGAYDRTATKLAQLFRENFRKYEQGASAEVKAAGPQALSHAESPRSGRGQLLHVHVVLAVRDLDALCAEALEDAPVEIRDHALARGWLRDPDVERELQPRGAEREEATLGRRLLAAPGEALGAREQHSVHLVDIRGAGHRHPGADALLDVGPTGLVDDLGVAHQRVGHRDLDVVAGEDARGAHADARDHAAQPIVEDHPVTDLVGRIGQDEDARDQMGQRVLGREAHRDADDAGRGQPRGHVDLPGQEGEVDRAADDQHLEQDVQERQRARLDQSAVPGASRQALQHRASHPGRRAGPDHDREHAQAGMHDEPRRARGYDQGRGPGQPDEDHGQEDRLPQALDDLVIDQSPRAARERCQTSVHDQLDQVGSHDGAEDHGRAANMGICPERLQVAANLREHGASRLSL
jgi:phosphoenolpyruvate carboxykinase (ATP)